MNENEQNMLGNIFLSHRAISTIVSHAALQSYGIVGLAPKNLAAGLAAAIVKDSSQGVNVKFDGGKYTVVPDDYEEVVETKTNEKPTKKTTEHKKVQLDEQKESD